MPRLVEASGHTKAWLVPMVCEPACRSSARNVPRLVEASARSMVPVAANGVRATFPDQLVPMVCETGARSIDCLKWGHFFQTGSRMQHGPVGANDV